MTATITPPRPGQQAEQDGFGRLLRAEWTKFRTVRGWVIGMIVAALLMLLIGLFAAGSSDIACAQCSRPGWPWKLLSLGVCDISPITTRSTSFCRPRS